MNRATISLETKRSRIKPGENILREPLSPEEPVREPIQLYLKEASKTGLLSANGERSLGMKIEAAAYLSRIEDDRYARYRHCPSPTDIL